MGELAITPRISLVAVCCSNASLSSLNNRTFSIAITAWSAKVLSKRDLLVGEWPDFRAADADRTDWNPFAKQRSAEHGPITMLWGAASSVIRSNRQEVMNMDRFTIDKRTTDHIIGEVGTDGTSLDRPISCDLSKQAAFDLHGNSCISRSTNTGSIFRHGIQHRLNIRRRASDDPQDFTCRSLLLQRLLEFVEQSHVLDRDHRLVGEGFEAA